ncbi:unnamed protein product [Cuscuta epithymum]|uniref:DUF6598 domain-containing protein n=1 Tax=Cuscuta epithymum TaxID=186058 RepID=A0AAV0DR81_9ASTE|nr:unnamed protein product [Cuscuta epithymum]
MLVTERGSSLGEGQGETSKRRKLDAEEAGEEETLELEFQDVIVDLHDSDSDWEFYEDHKQRGQIVERYSEEQDKLTNHVPDSCSATQRCSRFLHNTMEDSQLWSTPPKSMFELYRVELVLNKATESTFSGELHGSIGLVDQSFEVPTFPQIYYFKVSQADSVPFNLSYRKEFFLVPLSGPQPRPLLEEDHMYGIFFALKIGNKDLFEDGVAFKNNEVFGTDDEVTTGVIRYSPTFVSEDPCDPILVRQLVGGTGSNPITVLAYISLFRGSWASVDVVLRNGNRVVSSFYGYVYARSCIFDTWTCLLRIGSEDKLEPIMSDSGQRIPLTRSIVAVPWNSSLVVEAELYDQDGNLIFKATASSLARNSPQCHRQIIGGGAAFVDFRWGPPDE